MKEKKLSKTLLGNANHVVELLAQQEGEDMMALPEPFDSYQVWRESVASQSANFMSDDVIYRVRYEDEGYLMVCTKEEDWE